MNIGDYKDKDFTAPIRELYIQTQHWARHNENLIVAANVLIFSGVGAVSATIIKDPGALKIEYLILLSFIAAIGFVLTYILNDRYMNSIDRVVAYEKFFGFHEPLTYEETGIGTPLKSSRKKDWSSSLVPAYLHKPPKFAPESVWFFLTLHVLVLVSTLTLSLTRF